MPITQLDPKTALVVVDLQRGIVSLPLIDPVEGVVEKSKALGSAFRRRHLPVVMVNVAGSAPGHVFPRIGEVGSVQDILDLLEAR